MMVYERWSMIWLVLSFILFYTAEGSNGGVQSNCVDNTRIKWSFEITKEGNVTEYVLTTAPIELQTLFNSLYGKFHNHVVLRKPLCLYNPCLNGGTCNETFDGFHCNCQDGYEGKRCETSLYIQSVSLHGSNRTRVSEGLVGFTTRGSPEQIKLFISESWSMNTSHQVCQELGYSQGASVTVSGNVYSSSNINDTQKYGALQCDQTAKNLTDCWYEARQRELVTHDMIVAVVCCTVNTCGPEGKPLGISSGLIPDSAIVKSSCQANLDCDTAGRLNSSPSWVPGENDFENPWIQVSLQSWYIISGVVTQSHHAMDHWVSSYIISYSLDNNTWLSYRDVYTTSISKVFPGNYRRVTPVEHSLYPPLMARLIRFYPLTYIGSPSLRLELLGFGPLADNIGDIYEPNLKCSPPPGQPLGVQNRSIIPDSSFSAFSWINADFWPSKARLLGYGVWAPGSLTKLGWWKVDLGTMYHVTAVITQGRPPLRSSNEDLRQWISSFKLSLSLDDVTWAKVGEEECGLWKEFPANFDGETPVTNLFPSQLSARFVKLYPITFNNFAILRCEIIGF